MSKQIVEDFLDSDSPLRGQNYCLLSFISPEKVIKSKNFFLFHKFLTDITKGYSIEDEKALEKAYNDWLYSRQENLEQEFHEKNNFQTSIRGLKVRGVYDTIGLARKKAKQLQNRDPNFHVFVGQVGSWLPWDANADYVEEEEFANNQLNQLMGEYKKNREYKNQVFNEEKQSKIDLNKLEKLDELEELENTIERNVDSCVFNSDDPWLQRKNEEENNTIVDNVLDELDADKVD